MLNCLLRNVRGDGELVDVWKGFHLGLVSAIGSSSRNDVSI